ncbi:trehalose 6-phosphate phosphorylase [Halorhodospira abdelmalekii]|uniref:glycoside hydrolase family 65 protein n=1 Tax=Halorhodospira abdelmalekii TaxID=421629 RepID=UPI001907A47F|nr:glycoside hydrolase family 65 protein [Halorhodospira abdelmalekii]MBK1735254.1 trehalose 6-phosphate phosphorylase [Halorhodospira abdelmalekii]
MNLPKTSAWCMEYSGWEPDHQQHREALCTLGNGRFATRGAFEGASAGDVHYPGTYMAGGFNRRTSVVSGREVENEDLVNLPNWLCLNFRPAGEGEWLDFDRVEWLEFKQQLDIRHGILTYTLHFRDPQGRETRLISRRIVHMGLSHFAALHWQLEPLNWSGEIVVRSGIDGGVENLGVVRYRQLETKHLEVLEKCELAADSVLLRSMTNQSRVALAHAARTQVSGSDGEPVEQGRRLVVEGDFVGHDIQVRCEQGRPITVEKVATFFSARDRAICEPAHDAQLELARAESFESLLASHRRAWERYWNWWDIELRAEGNGVLEEQLVLRLHIFHLLQTTSLHTIDLDVGVPARGLHGEAYRGHIFWDELFILPLLNLHMPEITRALLMYRYRRLPEARWAAYDLGLRGAMYPWQSGSNGREESQILHLNPKSGRWLPDTTYKQRHINAAVAHNVWRYYEVTGDIEFMGFAGTEMMLSIAQFWASIAEHCPQKERYVIRGIVGPDEFHTRYPDRDEAGLDNNAYTNVMAAWCLRTAGEALAILAPTQRDDLLQRLGIDASELQRWDEVSRRMFVPFHGDDGCIISQFEGYEQLEPLDWEGLRARHGDIQRLDRLLEAEGDDVNRYQASKQADLLMLFYLFSSQQLKELLAHMGYDFNPEMIHANIEYYEARTSHGSTLSNIVHSWVLARSDRQRSWDLFGNALMSDVADVQGGTTKEGIHLGAMAGTVDLALRGYTGLELREGVLWLDPMLPDGLHQVQHKIHYRGHWITILVNHVRLVVSLEEGTCPPIEMGYRRRIYTLEQGQSLELPTGAPASD